MLMETLADFGVVIYFRSSNLHHRHLQETWLSMDDRIAAAARHRAAAGGAAGVDAGAARRSRVCASRPAARAVPAMPRPVAAKGRCALTWRWWPACRRCRWLPAAPVALHAAPGDAEALPASFVQWEHNSVRLASITVRCWRWPLALRWRLALPCARWRLLGAWCAWPAWLCRAGGGDRCRRCCCRWAVATWRPDSQTGALLTTTAVGIVWRIWCAFAPWPCSRCKAAMPAFRAAGTSRRACWAPALGCWRATRRCSGVPPGGRAAAGVCRCDEELPATIVLRPSTATPRP